MINAKSAKINSKLQNVNGNVQKLDKNILQGSYDPTYIYKVTMPKGNLKLSKIIEARLLPDLKEGVPRTYYDYEYYIHYIGLNRRMDEWVDVSRISKTN